MDIIQDLPRAIISTFPTCIFIWNTIYINISLLCGFYVSFIIPSFIDNCYSVLIKNTVSIFADIIKGTSINIFLTEIPIVSV